MSDQNAPFYGKFRGKVIDNRDPLMQGRIRAVVPDIFGENESGWAMPAVPYAGSGVGFFMVPPIDASVWIEFEHGEPEFPVWTGCFWAEGELPVDPAVAEMKVIKTESATITIDDTPCVGSVTIETTQGMKITLTATEIEMTNGQGSSIKLSGPTVSINDNALEIT